MKKEEERFSKVEATGWVVVNPNIQGLTSSWDFSVSTDICMSCADGSFILG